MNLLMYSLCSMYISSSAELIHITLLTSMCNRGLYIYAMKKKINMKKNCTDWLEEFYFRLQKLLFIA